MILNFFLLCFELGSYWLHCVIKGVIMQQCYQEGLAAAHWFTNMKSFPVDGLRMALLMIFAAKHVQVFVSNFVLAKNNLLAYLWCGITYHDCRCSHGKCLEDEKRNDKGARRTNTNSGFRGRVSRLFQHEIAATQSYTLAVTSYVTVYSFGSATNFSLGHGEQHSQVSLRPLQWFMGKDIYVVRMSVGDNQVGALNSNVHPMTKKYHEVAALEMVNFSNGPPYEIQVHRPFSIVTFACVLYNATVKGVWKWVIFSYKSPHWLINGIVMFIGIIVIGHVWSIVSWYSFETYNGFYSHAPEFSIVSCYTLET
ncbi:regulator of chromosome condensation (RCC1) family protein [Artemisia annua]|uniref:Regulator of chromosome condensation (RCC1) family protein n=1 Tax=Artemisia annua TaxID=35608 RepID=A0A2U1MXG1_ARTAN|nr:regulator of chromosome condensation (RCC1) family protein [Artemisia annua]